MLTDFWVLYALMKKKCNFSKAQRRRQSISEDLIFSLFDFVFQIEDRAIWGGEEFFLSSLNPIWSDTFIRLFHACRGEITLSKPQKKLDRFTKIGIRSKERLIIDRYSERVELVCSANYFAESLRSVSNDKRTVGLYKLFKISWS